MSFSKLDQNRIVGEALGLLKEGGLAGVSLRKVAARLNVGVASLYWHVKNKDQLYGLVAERIFRSCLEAVPPSATWQEWLRGFGQALWYAQNTIPDTRQLIVLSAIDGQVKRGLHDRIVLTLEKLGLERNTGSLAQQSVQALVTGWTTLRAGRPDHDIAGKAEFERALDALIRGWQAQLSQDRGVGE